MGACPHPRCHNLNYQPSKHRNSCLSGYIQGSPSHEITYVEGDVLDAHFDEDATENGMRWEKRLRVSAVRKA